jgi:S-formylglutathione hydrolase FrmB
VLPLCVLRRSGNEDWNRPELWSSEEWLPVLITGFATQRERTPRGRVFVNAAQTRENDPFELARHIDPRHAPFLHLDCGLQDGLLPETLAFAQQLRESGLSHALVLLPGDHEAPYWAEAFARTRLALQTVFTARAVAPADPPQP